MTALPPIPSHLPAWQAPHIAWLASQGHSTLYAVPEGTEAVRADLRGAYLRGAYLHGADLHGADLSGANLYGAVLSGANLYGAVLSGAKLREAKLREAKLREAKLRGADLSGADLSGADLSGASGIAAIGPVGRQRRLVYAVAHDGGPRIQAGCWWGSVPDTIARVEDDYADDPATRDRYVAAVRAVAALVTP